MPVFIPVTMALDDAHTHNLEQLIKLAGLGPEFDRAKREDKELELNWAIVKDWSETSRYDPRISEPQARAMFAACTSRKGGILQWIKARW